MLHLAFDFNEKLTSGKLSGFPVMGGFRVRDVKDAHILTALNVSLCSPSTLPQITLIESGMELEDRDCIMILDMYKISQGLF